MAMMVVTVVVMVVMERGTCSFSWGWLIKLGFISLIRRSEIKSGPNVLLVFFVKVAQNRTE